MLTILRFVLLLLILLLLSVLMIIVAPFVAINTACSYIAVKIVSSLYNEFNSFKKE